MSNQYTMQDPTTQYTKAGPEFQQQQEEPGLQKKMNPVPDTGEDTYKGTGRLTGRKALVTGADSGIGRAVAIAFAREGADIVLSYMPEEEEDAKQVVKLVQEAGRTAIAIPGDLKDETYCEQLVDTAVKELGGIDILANIAGKQQFVPDIADLTTKHFDDTFKTNVYAMFWLCKAAVKHMQPGSTIINTSSIQAYNPSPILLDYATTKAAINTFSKSLAQQVADKGIRVNVVAPGPVWTPLQVVGGQPEEVLKEFGSSTPLGRPGQPAEMAPAYVFLASQESSYISGETLNANGGTPTP
ncbi:MULTISPECIES: SDR family oxidoreductase [Paenibacillus]|jgi:NAD(P)-dependent dehydrogenase (short-subunit alcohol dehydrogenase family)|uniref:SDR family oxidoreductase n=1 Tax=Paenibacillus TaxID=44249 RepID=UPI00096FD63E|nr:MULTISPECIES: SDR family oxidoreductase [Paenibacillus]MDH6426742.1 NAD(P)-dependent dehydrogenase (short-subunit alcohol dehydrogenase family) [Paenibacillus sp. PastH-4]MDH6442768.1 NAD(P)-dependent dehydrogenase (short-subunit alcohol dehydrogenase family) [Paenibacillus sp. PastF-4]MDH6526522.1 NAD(P)-dependent dehydrogenase (short-subunit alcohol dehydrogenase family) [Paenibacillus sp. PastH-3]OMD58709.1 NAD(P)-dependent oxidoreductase [Paenibacillus odorifer]OMD60800.1 NAD(P)-depende